MLIPTFTPAPGQSIANKNILNRRPKNLSN